MPTLHTNQILWWVLWNITAFVMVLPYHSFVEWCVHRFVMHRRLKWLPFPYELHAIKHHSIFGSDESYHALDEHAKDHVEFVARDYVLLLLVNVPVYIAIEMIVGRPILVGCALANLAYTQAFNSLHWRFHVPSDSWFQRSKPFRFLKRHHLLHHEGSNKQNYNVVFPMADFLFNTISFHPKNPDRVIQI